MVVGIAIFAPIALIAAIALSVLIALNVTHAVFAHMATKVPGMTNA